MDDQDPIIQSMKKVAEAARHNAYCPYSNFKVGAAVLTDSGEVAGGCNVENASFGLAMCAERNAIFRAIAQGHKHIRALVIVTQKDRPAQPCGACRQVIHEFGPDAEVFSFGKIGPASHARLAELLPNAFGPEDLA
jgi:cytidine deaminase